MGEELTLDLKDILYILKKRTKFILSVTLIFTLISGIVSFFFLTPIYEANTSIVIGAVRNSNESDGKYDYSDVMMYQKLIKTFAKIAVSEDTALEAIKEKLIMVEGKDGLEVMQPKEFISMLSVAPQADTQIIDFKIQNESPKQAKIMVEAIAESFMSRVHKTFPEVNIDIIDSAKLPVTPVKPNKKMSIIVGMFLGLMTSVGITFLREFLDTTLKTQEEAEKIMGIPVLGSIPKHELEL